MSDARKSVKVIPNRVKECEYDEGMNQSSLIGGQTVRRRGEAERRDFLKVLGLAAAAGLWGCTPPKVKDNRIRHMMGQRVTIGSLTFNVLEMKWEQTLGDPPLGRTPERRFLLLRLSVTNGGGSPATVPAFTLLAEEGEQFKELQDTTAVADPLGMVRKLAPSETLFGWILFDAPQNNYLLELSDGNLENEQTALVEIPLRLT